MYLLLVFSRIILLRKRVTNKLASREFFVLSCAVSLLGGLFIFSQIVFTVTDDDANNTDDAGLSRLVFGIQEIDEALDAPLPI